MSKEVILLAVVVAYIWYRKRPINENYRHSSFYQEYGILPPGLAPGLSDEQFDRERHNMYTGRVGDKHSYL